MESGAIAMMVIGMVIIWRGLAASIAVALVKGRRKKI
ncbi:MAG TPA: methionine/alanine import family NSS transporter small subunit [Paenibacillaceae bacterium]